MAIGSSWAVESTDEWLGWPTDNSPYDLSPMGIHDKPLQRPGRGDNPQR